MHAAGGSKPVIKFGYTICYVPDVNETLSFFENAFGMTRRFLTEENDYGEMETGNTVLAFASESLGQANLPGGFVKCSGSETPLGIEIALVTDDVESNHSKAIKHGGQELKAPEKKPWGQVVSYIRSPSGVLVELCTPVGNG